MGFWNRIRSIFRREKKVKITPPRPPQSIAIEKEQPKERATWQPDIQVAPEIVSEIEVMKPQGSRYRKKSDYDSSITGSGAFTLDIDELTAQVSSNENDYKREYGLMLGNKVKDKDLFEDLLIHKEEILRKRTVLEVTFYSDKGETAVMTVNGGLPEDLAELQNYWLNETISSNEFSFNVSAYEDYMQGLGKGVISCTNKVDPSGYWKVKRISVKGDFR